MKFSIPCATLLKPLQFVIGVVERRQTLPILGNVLLSIVNQQLALVGTDLEVELIGRVDLPEACDDIEITVPARKLMDICRHLPDSAMLQFSVEENKLLLKSGRSRFSLATLPADEFPIVDDGDYQQHLRLPSQKLLCLLQQTHFAMAQQDVRYFLNGALLHIEADCLTVVATDGHRLALANSELAKAQTETKIIVPRKAILEIMKLLNDDEDDVELRFNNNHICVSAGNFTLTSKLVEGRYPDYQKVIPRHGDKQLILDKNELKQALTRVSILSNEKFRGVRLDFTNETLIIAANNPEREEAEDSLKIHYQGDDLSISFNVNYLLDAINALDNGDIKLTLSDGKTSALVEHNEKNQESLYVVMPMRI